jgi:hypothetical protein
MRTFVYPCNILSRFAFFIAFLLLNLISAVAQAQNERQQTLQYPLSAAQKQTLEEEVARFTPGQFGTLGIITGPDSICLGVPTQYHLTLATPNGSPIQYYWFAPVGWRIINGQGTATVTVIADAETEGFISVFAFGFCICTFSCRMVKSYDCCDNLAVGPITGPGSIDLCDTVTTCGSFSVPANPAVLTYTWTVPEQLMITGGQGTSTAEICLDTLLATPGIYNITLTAESLCDTVVINRPIEITDSLCTFPLPVQLISFTAKRNANTVVLNWKTGSEQDNKEFVVERSFNGKTFNPIGTIAGNGTTTRTNDYTFIDKQALAGVSYYRFKQVDLNGEFGYSPIRTVSATSEALDAEFSAYPNPASSTLQLVYPNADAKAFIRISSITGQIVWEGTAAQLSTTGNQVDISKFESGSYLITFTSDQQTRSIRINKL